MVFLDGEDRDQHALVEEIGLFDKVDDVEPPRSFFLVPAPKEEPIVVSVSIQVILDEHVVLQLGDVNVDVSPADVAALEVRVDALLALIEKIDLERYRSLWVGSIRLSSKRGRSANKNR